MNSYSHPCSSLTTEFYDPKTFFTHAALLGQTFVHCRRFPTAASRRSLGRVSVPMWPITLSGRLCIVALVSRYLTNLLMHRGSIHQRHPKAPFKSKPCGFDCYTVLAPVSKCYPLLMGRLPTCYSPVRHSSFSGGASSGGKRSVRLACIRHAASVRPEPGSNSHKKFEQSCDC